MTNRLSLVLLLLLTASPLWGGEIIYQMYTGSTSNNALYSVDPASLNLASIGDTGQPGQFGNLAYDSGNGTLYWVPGRDNQNLYTVNTTTGAATLVGSYGIAVDMNGLAYDPNTDKLFSFAANNNDTLYTLNPATGAATAVGATGADAISLAYNTKTSQLILFSPSESFYSVNETTAATTLLGSNPAATGVNDSGITYDPTRDVYWVNSILSELYQYNPSTFARTSELALPGLFEGIAYVNTGAPTNLVPEPAMFLPVLLMLAAGFVYRTSKFRPRKVDID